MAINRVQAIWSGTIVEGGGLSTFYFDTGVGTPAQHVAAVATFLTATDDQRSTGAVWTTGADVAAVDEATGALVSVTSVATSTGTGTAVGDTMPPATQGLLRALSSVVVGGRLLRGRVFLPGAVESANIGGLPIAAYRTDYDTAAAALIANLNAQWVIWSRTHGVIAPVASANVWSKWAVLRSRRD